jgi:hypothetical protein
MEPLSQSPETQEPAVSDAVEVRPRPEPKLAILKRFMGKVGLDASTLILMFKSDINLPYFASSGTFYTNIFFLSSGVPSLLLSAYRYINHHLYILTSRRWAI